MTRLTWRAAQKLQEQRDAIQEEKNKELEKILAKELSSIPLSNITANKDRPWFSSRMRIRAALADCKSHEIRRVKDVVTEMIQLIEEEEDRMSRQRETLSALRDMYNTELGDPFDSFDEFVQSLK